MAFEIVFISRGVFEGLGFGWGYYLKKIPVWKIFGIFGEVAYIRNKDKDTGLVYKDTGLLEKVEFLENFLEIWWGE